MRSSIEHSPYVPPRVAQYVRPQAARQWPVDLAAPRSLTFKTGKGVNHV